ncbi:GL16547 [Drosophila persimilis]|uniref:GL16547 n=1 Tax=Drosophila persimilis TaxID=7234 RepID=B4GWG2_DROPE|nr:GL16547 [Drosophila persimilis]
MNKLEPQTVRPIARSTQRGHKRTSDYWKAKLLKAETVLKLQEENLEKLLANSYAAIAHGEVSLEEVIPTSSSLSLSEESQREEQVLELVEKVVCQMRLFRHQAAIIDLGLVLLTIALLACAYLWENTALLLSSCLLLSLLCWSIFLAILGRVMGPKIVLADYTAVSSYNAIFEISCVNITALSIISMASAALRSASGVVGPAMLWGFLLPIVSFANMLWWDSSNGSSIVVIVLALLDIIFIWLTVSVVWRECVSYRGVNSFLTDQDLKQVRSYTLNHCIEPTALKHADGEKEQENDKQEPLPASHEATFKEDQEHKPGA